MRSCRTTAHMLNACSANASRRIQSDLHLAAWEAALRLSTERRGIYSRDPFRSFATEQKGDCDAAFVARPLGTAPQPEPQSLGRMFQLGANAFFESNEWKRSWTKPSGMLSRVPRRSLGSWSSVGAPEALSWSRHWAASSVARWQRSRWSITWPRISGSLVCTRLLLAY